MENLGVMDDGCVYEVMIHMILGIIYIYLIQSIMSLICSSLFSVVSPR